MTGPEVAGTEGGCGKFCVSGTVGHDGHVPYNTFVYRVVVLQKPVDATSSQSAGIFVVR